MSERNYHRVVYSITDKDSDRSYWTRIGVTRLNKDGSESVLLDALPLGRMIIQDPKKVDEEIERNQ